MEIDEAIDAALRMHPDKPGAGRLCQELLAAVTGQRVQARAASSVYVVGAAHIRAHRRLNA